MKCFFESLRQRNADELLVVAGENALLSECWMAPGNAAAEGSAGRLQHVPTAHFVVACRAKLGDNQVARFRDEEKAVLVLDDVGGAAPRIFADNGLVGFPDAIARLDVHAA